MIIDYFTETAFTDARQQQIKAMAEEAHRREVPIPIAIQMYGLALATRIRAYVAEHPEMRGEG